LKTQKKEKSLGPEKQLCGGKVREEGGELTGDVCMIKLQPQYTAGCWRQTFIITPNLFPRKVRRHFRKKKKGPRKPKSASCPKKKEREPFSAKKNNKLKIWFALGSPEKCVRQLGSAKGKIQQQQREEGL